MTHEEQRKQPEYQEWAIKMRTLSPICEVCEKPPESERKLEIHHKFYERSRYLWEYSSSEVIVACRSCHQRIHDTSGTTEFFIQKGTEKLDTEHDPINREYSEEIGALLEPKGNFARDLSDEFERDLEWKLKLESMIQDRSDDLQHCDNSIDKGWPYED